jgi:tRNA A37 threonylcarbamoyladenosine dehydratase
MQFSIPMTAIRHGTALALATLLLAGCVHPITMITETAPPRSQAHLIPKKVAYVMTDADRDKEVVTPGGSGDRVSYFPYRDLEKSIRDALRAVYRDVVVLRTAGDAKANEAAGVSLVFTPRITTDSSSSSWISWPPTSFTAEVSCVVTDAAGAEITRVRAAGNGTAEFGEFKGDFGLAARRAATRLTSQLSSEIRRSEKLR